MCTSAAAAFLFDMEEKQMDFYFEDADFEDERKRAQKFVTLLSAATYHMQKAYGDNTAHKWATAMMALARLDVEATAAAVEQLERKRN
jgi:hypothetical protein